MFRPIVCRNSQDCNSYNSQGDNNQMSDYKFISNMVAPDEINRQNEAKALVSKWAKTGLLKKLTDRKAQVMSRLLDTEAKELKKLNEASTISDIAGFNKIAFPLVRRVFAQLIANEIVAVQPMSLPSGLLFYLDFKYDRTKNSFSSGGSVYGSRDSVFNQGLQGIGGQNATGSFYELASGYSTRAYLLSGAIALSGIASTYGSITSENFLTTVSAYSLALPSSAVADIMQLQNMGLVFYGEGGTTVPHANETVLASNSFRGYQAIESLTSETFQPYIDHSLTQFDSNGKVTFWIQNTGPLFS